MVTGICCEAEKLGLRIGDIIANYDGQEVVNHFTLEQQMTRVGFKKRTLMVMRDGKQLSFQVSPGLIGIYFWSTASKNGQ
jgi:S1-C subfamily serine protease